MSNKVDYIAQKISEPISIDGNLTKLTWQKAQWSKRFVDMVTGEHSLFNTQTAIVWDDSHLYIAFKAEEPFVEAHLTARDSIIFLENGLELFIDGGDCYYELEVNAANTIYEVFFIWRDAFKNLAAITIVSVKLFGVVGIRAVFVGHLQILICSV